MLFTIIFLIVSMLPPVLIFFYIRNTVESENAELSGMCSKALLQGVLCVFGVMLCSAVTSLILYFTGLVDTHPVIYAFLRTFIVFAFSEELVKFLALRHFMRKRPYPYSPLTVVAIQSIIGTGFGLAEAIPYALGADAMTMIVRGLTMGHTGYGFIMGWFYAGYLKTGKKKYAVTGFMLPLVLHGLYDFGLSEQLEEVNENFGIISLFLALVSIVTIVIEIRFFRKRRHDEEYCAAFNAPGAVPDPSDVAE